MYFANMSKSFMSGILLWVITLPLGGQPPSPASLARWKAHSQQTTIIRDTWGIPHIYGKTDADAVFGLLYAQCEDDFARVEENYIEKLGRRAEVYGPRELYEDLLIRLVLDSAAARRDYENAPPWLKKLCLAFADGVNYYLYKHPQVKPKLLTQFEPWWPLLWTDGSIGAISTGGAAIQELESFYSGKEVAAAPAHYFDDPQTGSNGLAFAPKLTKSGHTILYINPHTTFYFRPEVHMVSQEGLNAYGAVTWGQFFIYQGFNEYCGWMHTSSQADVADLYAEEITATPTGYTYKYDGRQLAVTAKPIELYAVNGNARSALNVTAYFTHHGPVVAKRQGKWLALKHHNRSMQGLIQSWQRTKASSFAQFKQVMYLKENTSNNTVYADREGNIAYWHGNFMPRRHPGYDWSQPVDGTTPATEWQPVHMVDDMVRVYNPANGWIQNCNQTPFSCCGPASPQAANYPTYMAPDAENFRGLNAVRVWSQANALTLDDVIAGSYTRYLPAFEPLIPVLAKYRQSLSNLPDSIRPQVAEAIDTLAAWNLHSAIPSVATTLAIEWGQRLLPALQRTPVAQASLTTGLVEKTNEFVKNATPDDVINPLVYTLNDLKKRFGTWKIPWGALNRYQRLTGRITEQYHDTLASLPVPFAAATWGALPSYVSRIMPGTQLRYGYSGNSFVCAVEFGKKVKAKSVLAGGNSSNPTSAAFANQAALYTSGTFKQVLFYKEDVLKHKARQYKP